jgi:hypothetical protein
VTFRKEIELCCDGLLPNDPFGCPTGPIFALSAVVAWREAKESGWVRRLVDGKVRHLCPLHKGSKSRGNCSVCGREQAVTVAGTIYPHRQRNPDGSYRRYAPWCPGTGKPPQPVTEDASNPRADTGTGQ